jgi:hypothetical protein
MPREAHAAQDVDLEYAHPFLVDDLEKRDAVVITEVVYQDVELRQLGEYRLGAGGATAVRGDPAYLCAGNRFAKPGKRRIDRRLGATVDRDTGPFRRQAAGNGVADSAGRARDEGTAVFEL